MVLSALSKVCILVMLISIVAGCGGGSGESTNSESPPSIPINTAKARVEVSLSNYPTTVLNRVGRVEMYLQLPFGVSPSNLSGTNASVAIGGDSPPINPNGYSASYDQTSRTLHMYFVQAQGILASSPIFYINCDIDTSVRTTLLMSSFSNSTLTNYIVFVEVAGSNTITGVSSYVSKVVPL